MRKPCKLRTGKNRGDYMTEVPLTGLSGRDSFPAAFCCLLPFLGIISRVLFNAGGITEDAACWERRYPFVDTGLAEADIHVLRPDSAYRGEGLLNVGDCKGCGGQQRKTGQRMPLPWQRRIRVDANTVMGAVVWAG